MATVDFYNVASPGYYKRVWNNATTPLNAVDCEGGWQTFTAVDGTIDTVRFWLRRTGSPTGNAYAKVYALSGTHGTTGTPTGSALATSSALDVSTVLPTAGWIPLTFPTGTLTAGTYAITFESPNGDAANYLRLYCDEAGTHDGNAGTFVDTTFEAIATHDLIFEVDMTTGDDVTAPVISISGVTDGYNSPNAVTITFTALDAVDGAVTPTASLNGAAFTSGTTVSDAGMYTLIVSATDAADNTATTTIGFAIAEAAPEVSFAVTHTFVSAKEDTADESVLQPSDWNADHTITGGINDSFTVGGVTYTIVNGFVTAAE